MPILITRFAQARINDGTHPHRLLHNRPHTHCLHCTAYNRCLPTPTKRPSKQVACQQTLLGRPSASIPFLKTAHLSGLAIDFYFYFGLFISYFISLLSVYPSVAQSFLPRKNHRAESTPKRATLRQQRPQPAKPARPQQTLPAPHSQPPTPAGPWPPAAGLLAA